jgi:hypothetical protein
VRLTVIGVWTIAEPLGVITRLKSRTPLFTV